MTDQEIMAIMRSAFSPKGTEPVSAIRVTVFLEWDFIQKCLDEIEKMEFNALLGHPPSNLEALAVYMLANAAGIQDVRGDDICYQKT
jgi:hypothetical protein